MLSFIGYGTVADVLHKWAHTVWPWGKIVGLIAMFDQPRDIIYQSHFD